MTIATPEKLEVYRNFLLSLARRHLGSALRPKVSESDIVQSTLLQAHNKLETFRGATEEELRAWLAKILHNQCVNETERYFASQKRDITRERSDISAKLISHDPSVSTAMVSVETINKLLIAMQDLPEEQQEIIQLRHVDQLSLKEISERLGISRDAAHRRWKAALKKLGALLKDHA